MKKITLILGTWFFSATISAALPTSASDYHVNAPLFHSAFVLGASALFWAPSTFYQDYAVIYPQALFEGGHFKSDRPKVDFGYQFYASYLIPCSSNDVKFTYTEFFEKDSDHSVAQEGLILPGTFPLPLVPVPAVTADVLLTFTIGGAQQFLDVAIFPFPADLPIEGQVQATVFSEYKQQAIDLDFGQFLDVDYFLHLRFFSGLRYANLKHRFDTQYVLSELTASQTQRADVIADIGGVITVVPIFTTMTLTSDDGYQLLELQNSKFSGIGPRFGMEGSFHLGGGFGLTGSLSTALLVGEHKGSFSKTFQGAATFEVASYVATTDVSGIEDVTLSEISLPVGTLIPTTPIDLSSVIEESTTRIAPNLEAKIGIDYTYLLKHCRTFRLEVGYYLNHYFNVIDRFGSSNAVEGVTVKSSNTMGFSFSGPYLTIDFTL